MEAAGPGATLGVSPGSSSMKTKEDSSSLGVPRDTLPAAVLNLLEAEGESNTEVWDVLRNRFLELLNEGESNS